MTFLLIIGGGSLLFAGGFVLGALVANNNQDTVKKAVDLGEEIAGTDEK